MNVANLELCETLFELSGWDDTGLYWLDGYEVISDERREAGPSDMNVTTAYDLGYLLRKLPPKHLELTRHHGGVWEAICFGAHDTEEATVSVYENGPEDAACKLAIELLKQGILTREDSQNGE